MRKLLPLLLVFTLVGCSNLTGSVVEGDSNSTAHSVDSSQGMSADRLSNSPRHQEWVEVKSGNKTIYTWVVYPIRDAQAPVVILIHENKGLNDWARGMADQVAEAGYIAVAPDLLSTMSTERMRTSDYPTADDATKAISQLKPEDVDSDLQAVVEWAKTIPSGNGKIATAGFCWGGGKSFRFAGKSDDLSAALVFYGTGPTEPADYKNISVPVFGFYGGADELVAATIPQSEKEMKDAGKTYDYQVYDGAAHAFMRLGEYPNGEAANITARNAAWERMKTILSSL